MDENQRKFHLALAEYTADVRLNHDSMSKIEPAAVKFIHTVGGIMQAMIDESKRG